MVNMLLVLALLAALIPLALLHNNAALPGIAEFAPQAQNPISQAPAEQQGSFGSGAGGGPAQPSPSPPAKAPGSNLPPGAKVNHCIGDPPRQIEDPQSPPCVADWVGDNGGATAPGVSGSNITIAAYTKDAALIPDLQRFFNDRFEFYDRHVTLVAGPNAGGGNQCPGRESDADQVATQLKAFAATDFEDTENQCFYAELGKDRVISVSAGTQLTEADMNIYTPYIWQYPMAYERQFYLQGVWACQRLAGRNAVHSGNMQALPRKFGVIYEYSSAGFSRDTVSQLQAGLATCGSSLADAEYITDDGNTGAAGNPTYSTSAVTSLKTHGVTSVFCLCVPYAEQYISSAADQQVYFPEWLMSSYGAGDVSENLRVFFPQQDQQAHVFGITFQPPQLPYAEEPVLWAVHEHDPTFKFNTSNDMEQNGLLFYRSLLLIASGIQMAGPHLTAAGFQRALQATVFPNPTTPYNAGDVGFAGGFHSMTEDYAEYWWSATSLAPYADEGAGTLCYVDDGARRNAGSKLVGDPFFNPGSCPQP